MPEPQGHKAIEAYIRVVEGTGTEEDRMAVHKALHTLVWFENTYDKPKREAALLEGLRQAPVPLSSVPPEKIGQYIALESDRRVVYAPYAAEWRLTWKGASWLDTYRRERIL